MTHLKFSRFIKDRRSELGLSQQEIADELGFSTSQFVSNIERGISHLPKYYVKPLARCLLVPPSRLVRLILEDIKREYEREIR